MNKGNFYYGREKVFEKAKSILNDFNFFKWIAHSAHGGFQ